MSRTGNMLMIGGSFVLALGAGLLMQQHEASASRHKMLPAPAGLAVSVAGPVAPAAPESLMLGKPVREAVQRAALPVLPVPDAPVPSQATARACDATLTAAPLPGAMAALRLSAPCHRDARAVIHHRGMMFSVLTDDQGLAQVDVPALSARAVFVAGFEDQTGAVASLDIADLETVSRVVVQWQGPGGFELHGRSEGAAYGGAGDIWRDHPADAAGAAVLTALGGEGADPLSAEIYSFPATSAPIVTVEAQITDANCGRLIAAQSLLKTMGAQLRNVDMTVTMPGCDAVGDYIVLPNLLAEPRIAAR